MIEDTDGDRLTKLEKALVTRDEWLELAAEGSELGLWYWDENKGELFWDSKSRDIFGIDAKQEMTLEAFYDAVHPEDAVRVQEVWRREFIGGLPYELEYRALRKDGTIRWITARGKGHYDDAGNPSHMVGVHFDTTARKETADEERLKLIVGELSHRIKNTLSIVQSLAHQSFKDGHDSARALIAFQGRLDALAKAHNVLTSTHWASADLNAILTGSVEACGAAGRILLEGPDLKVEPSAAVSLAIGIHELCTNALKYGALSNAVGRIHVSWTLHEPTNHFRLTWQESGGPAVTKPDRRGFGSRMLERALAKQLNADVRLNFEPNGLECFIDAPLSTVRHSAVLSEA